LTSEVITFLSVFDKILIIKSVLNSCKLLASANV
jgi:hypothetical protein